MRACLFAAILALTSAIWTPVAKGDPGPVVHWLMNQPASLFDVGLIELDRRLQNDREDIKGHSISASYSWDENRLIIQGYFFNLGQGRAEAEKRCSRFFRHTRQQGFVNPDTGKLLGGEYSIYAGHFQHQGYRKEYEPENYQARLDKVFVIRVFASFSEQGQRDGLLECEGPLLGTGYSVKKN